jgi:hypothetical protein
MNRQYLDGMLLSLLSNTGLLGELFRLIARNRRESQMKQLNLLIVLAGMVISAQGQAWITNGLIAYYPFNGNANDASGNGNNGVLSGASFTLDRFGFAAKALRITNGATMSAPLANLILAHTNTSTISAWVKFISFRGQFGNIASIGGGQCGDFGTSLSLHNTQYVKAVVGIDCTGYPNYVQAIHQQSVNTNQWYNLVSTFSNGALLLYLDGLQVALTNIVPQLSYSLLPNSLFIGNASTSTINAIVDDVRIYNRALSASEVGQLYATEAGYLNIHKAVYLDTYNLAVGSNYQLQVSTDLQNWTNQGTAFTATNSYWRSTYWDVDNWNDFFFRLLPQ